VLVGNSQGLQLSSRLCGPEGWWGVTLPIPPKMPSVWHLVIPAVVMLVAAGGGWGSLVVVVYWGLNLGFTPLALSLYEGKHYEKS